MTTASTTVPEIEFTKADRYGQSHPIETPQVVEASLKAFAAKVSQANDKYLKQASEKCPKLFHDPDFQLLFLRCEVFNLEVS